MAIGSNLSCVRFGTWIDHFITEERQTWAINLTEEWGHVVPSNCNPVFYFHARFIYHAHVSFHWLHDPIILGSVILRKCDTQVTELHVTSDKPQFPEDRTDYQVSVSLCYFENFPSTEPFMKWFSPKENCSIQRTRSGANEQDPLTPKILLR